jgi:hypothetical protein
MQTLETLSLCGLYCGGCKNYKENANCMGCRNENELLADCPTRSCCIQKGLLHCGECEEFPCTILNAFYTDGIRHHELAYQNMLKIRTAGVDSWLHDQERRHTCACGKKIPWFALKCEDEDCVG